MDGIIGSIIVSSIFSLGLLLPNLAICCRRLRDGGFSPWLILLSLIPGIGALALAVMFCLPSKQPHNDENCRFNATDRIITGGCVGLAGVGMYLSLSSLLALSSGGFNTPAYDVDSYDEDETEYVTEVTEVNDYEPSTEGDAPMEVLPVSGSLSQFSYLSEDTLDVENFHNYTPSELRILRNAIFAMHGYRFDSADLSDYFSNFYDYTPRTKNVDLSATEQYNVNLIKSYEQ